MSRKPPLRKERLERARELRNEPTEAEKKLWEHLRRKNLSAKFRRQHPVGPFILDFYCHEARLAVEVDGWAWQMDVERFRADRHKGNALVRARWTLLRFTWHDLTHRPDYVVAEIRAALLAAAA